MDLFLQPKQAEVYNSSATEILYGGAAGSGKAGDLEIDVPTLTGWKKLKDISVGDRVFSDTGEPCNVVAVSDIMLGRPCYKVTFSDGNNFIVDEEHQWMTYTDKERSQWIRSNPEWKATRRAKRPSRAQFGDKFDWLKKRNSENRAEGMPRPLGSPKTTLEIKSTLKFRETRFFHSIEMPKAVVYQEKDLLINPWILGFWLGDGTSASSQVTSADEHNIERLRAFYEVRKHESTDYSYGVIGLQKQLRELGVLSNKHIPDEYLRGSVEQRKELLRGLMDSDGYCAKNGKINFDNTNKRIIDGFMELIQSLGIRGVVSSKTARLYGKDCGITYRVNFVANFSVFSLPRRLINQKLNVKPECRRRRIVAVEKVESVPVKCIQVDSHNSVFLWGRGYVPTHNSHLMRILAISYCVAIPGVQVYLFRRTSPDLVANHLSGPSGFPALLSEWTDNKQVSINYSKNEIRFNNNGSSIHLCHCQHESNKFNYQGAEVHILLVDELCHFTESIYRYLRGRVRLGGLQVPAEYKHVMPRIVCGANPGGEGHNWVKKTFIDFAPPNTVVKTPKEEGGFRRAFIPAKLADNQVLVENDPEYSDRLSGLGTEQLVQAMRDGNWDIAAGGYFDDVWSREYNVLEPFDIPSSWRIDRSFDWGSSKPFSVGFWAESDGTEVTLKDGSTFCLPRGSLIRIGEIYGWNGKANEGCGWTAVKVAEVIVEYQAAAKWGNRVHPGPADGSIFDKENGNCIADDMKTKGVYWTRADKKPGSRKIGWQQMRKMFVASAERPRENPGLYVFSHCVHFIRTVPTLSRDKNDSEDVDSKAEDHVADESRYRVNYKVKVASTMPVTGL